MLGILGGMGPLATADFFRKIVEGTAVNVDQKHIPTLIWSVPQIADRSESIVNGGESPLPQLRRGVQNLKKMGASVIAIPCNTAHFWYEDLARGLDISIFHIADSVIDVIKNKYSSSQLAVGILGTTGTVLGKIYQSRFDQVGWDSVVLDTQDQKELMVGIALVKSGHLDLARKIFNEKIERLKDKGAAAVVLGCTEIPSVVEESHELIDSSKALATRCVRWFYANYGQYEGTTYSIVDETVISSSSISGMKTTQINIDRQA